jgi:hypothetical protein
MAEGSGARYLSSGLIPTLRRSGLESRSNSLYPCESVVEVLPGQNPFVSEFAAKYGIPLEATLGGAETMYPEFQQKMKGMVVPKK